MRLALVIFLLCPLMCQVAHAGDLGTYGQTFEIIEIDLLRLLGAKLKAAEASGRIETMNREFAARTRKKVETPQPVAGVRLTQTPKTWLFDPSIVVPQDLSDHQGRVFARRGDRINPLQRLPGYNKVLVFIDGNDPSSVDYALSQTRTFGSERVVLILTNGQPLRLAKASRVAFYFDQQGLLTKKFGITQVPAIVQREGDALRIRELRP